MSFSIENTKTIDDTKKLEDSGKLLKFYPIAIFLLGLYMCLQLAEGVV